MPRRPNAQVTFTNVATDVLNAIKNSATTDYSTVVPYAAPDAESLREIGNIIVNNPAVRNEFLDALVNRIALMIIQSKSYRNPLAMFKRGFLELGETVEVTFVELAEVFNFDADVAETEVEKKVKPDVRSMFTVMNFQKFYKATVSSQMLKAAFLSWDGLNQLLDAIVQQLYTAMEYDEFQVMKYMLARQIQAGRLYPVTVDPADRESTVAAMREMSNNFTFMKTDYNQAHVHNFTSRDDQFIIINTHFDAEMSVKVLATAFNMTEAELLGHRVLIDGFGGLDIARLNKLLGDDPGYHEFGTSELEALDKIPAVLVDRKYFLIFDHLLEAAERQNQQGLYWNRWLHAWKTFAVSIFANAAMFLPAAPTVTSVTVNPATATLAKGATIQLSANVVTTNFAPMQVTWASNSENVTVTPEGLVKVLSTASAGTVEITATSVFDPTKTGKCTITVQ